MQRTFLLFLLIVAIYPLKGQTVIPIPADISISGGYYRAEAEKIAIRRSVDNSIARDGYRLLVDSTGVSITASGAEGFYYAWCTLEQLTHHQGNSVTIPCLQINDTPRYGYRCFLLDSGRQYQRLETIRKYIDMAAMLKMNYFHWHLTDGLGWRVEIKKYPLLTEKGAFVGKEPEQHGFYTQDEIKSIIAYARERFITVIPEIDIPGHAEAALTAYPALGCFNEPVEVPQIGFTHHIMCGGKHSTISFLKDVLDEICMLFLSEYIHLGGDEALKGNWDRCPDCQKRLQELGLSGSQELQLWLSAELATYLKGKGKQAIFWEDIIYQGNYPLPDNVVIQWWNYRGHGEDGLTKALAKNLRVIAATNYYTYINFPLTPWKGYDEQRTFDIQDIYERNPAARSFDNPLVLGMGCALWTDYNVTESIIDKRLFPRILALAQQMWYTGKNIPFTEFYKHVREQQPWFEARGYEFGPGLKEEVPAGYKWD